jgi:VIT1/CCC1 family predicted Fe2+/Mn2+ transporter
MSNFLEANAMLIGYIFGCALSLIAFFTIPAYHNYIVWAWTTPWFLAASATAALLGIVYCKKHLA